VQTLIALLLLVRLAFVANLKMKRGTTKETIGSIRDNKPARTSNRETTIESLSCISSLSSSFPPNLAADTVCPYSFQFGALSWGSA
jgi:hypothetical protein